MKKLILPAHYYRQHDADVGSENPALGFAGWDTRLLEVPLESTALVSMHVWNIGSDERLPYGPNSAYIGLYRYMEWLSRAIRIVREVFPDLLTSARKAGMTVIHVGTHGEKYVGRFSEYQRIKKLAGPEPEEPAGAPDDSLRKQWEQERRKLRQGEHNFSGMAAADEYIDFPPQVMPLDGEPVVLTSRQLNLVCREKGIWHLVYVGFCINWCLLWSQGGMFDMSRLGYVCSTIRQATTAAENRETCIRELAKEIELWRIAMAFGYVFDVEPFIDALRQVREE